MTILKSRAEALKHVKACVHYRVLGASRDELMTITGAKWRTLRRFVYTRWKLGYIKYLDDRKLVQTMDLIKECENRSVVSECEIERAKMLDQFFTHPDIGAWVKNTVEAHVNCDGKLIMEPSAGDRSISLPFIDAGYRVLESDLDPKHDGIIKCDFLDFSMGEDSPNGFESPRNVVVVGNPPFGFASSLAVKFFNKAAELADVVAFIIPKTFRKKSIQNKLDDRFGLVLDSDLPFEPAFLLAGQPYDVPCCFQIWKRIDNGGKRGIVKVPKNVWFEFTTKDDAEFSIRRVGGRAGQVLEGTDYNENSTYFIKPLIDNDTLKEALKSIDFSEIVCNTAGVRSVSKDEILIELSKTIK